MDRKSRPDRPERAETLEAQLAAIVATSQDAIASKDLNGIVQTWNAAAERIFGYTAEEMIGQSITRIIPDDRSFEEEEILSKIRRGERVEHFKTVRCRKDGELILISVSISPIVNREGRIVGASKIARDLTRTAHMERMFEAIVESSDDAIVSKSLDGTVRSWNRGAEEIFGYTAEEMIGESLTKIFPPERLQEEVEIIERLRRGERIDHFETVRVRKDGERIHVSVTISPIHGPGGDVVGASKIARDITPFRRAVEERERMLESERFARSEAEQASRVKDEFLATISHELRTPLNSILGWAQILRRGSSDEASVARGLEVIERNARVQTQIIEDLLEMSRILSGKTRLDVQRLSLAPIVEMAVEAVQTAADAKGVQLHVVLDPLAGPVTGDPNRLQQVFWNLLTNAIKFTPSGGHVQVLLERVNSHLEVSVIDTGEGIPPEFLPIVFDRFRQADASTTRRHGGLGLGLSIVKHLVELHGGTVRAKSPGVAKGSTFTVMLPVTPIHPEPTPGNPRRHPRSEGLEGPPLDDWPSLEGVEVLAVDDEADSLEMVQRLLQEHGATVYTAASADEALEALQSRRPQVLVSDIGMPVVDGYELIRRVRKLDPEAGGRTPAVALTAYARSEDRRNAILAGYQLHVAKPVEPAELITMVASLAGKT